MWIWIRNVVCVGMIVGLVSPVFGEYYQYRDENGVLRYTDDLSTVPPEQRPDVTAHQTIESEPVNTTRSATTAKAADEAGALSQQGGTPSGGTWQENNAQKREGLDRMRAELNQTFEALQAERTQLAAEMPPKGSTFKERTLYNQRVDALNAKIIQYESQLELFNKEVSAYNSQIGSKPAP